jgi:hypothetical protein
MIDLIIYTYGYHEALYNVLQAIAMFRNSQFFTTLINAVCLLVGMYYAVRMSYSQSHSHWRMYLMKAFGMLVLVNSLLLPTTNMILKDQVTKKISTIDHIPLAFALPIGLMEDFGHLLTIGFEQALAPIEAAVNPDDPMFSYYHYGMLFGARLKKEVSQARIKNPEFVENMHNFIKQCVVLPAMIGYQFTPEQLLNSKNIWGLVSKKAGTLTRLDMRIGSDRSTMNCREAVSYFENYFAEESNRIIAKNQNTEFGMARTSSTFNVPQSGLAKVFEKNVKVLYGGTESALNILKQQMMINSLSDYTSGSYAVSRARQQQESSWLLSSDIASLYLPMVLAVAKCIFYAAFIFLAPMLVLGGGMTRYMGYLTMVASLQLWPSLNAIINMILGTYSNLTIGSDKLISFSAASTIGNHVDTIVTVAAGLQLVIPFLAFALMQGGVGGIMHLAGSVIGGMQSTAGAIGAEKVSGNRSFDNISEGTSSRNIKSANKTDHNMQYFDGVNGWNNGDGSMARQNPDGRVVYSGGAGITDSSGGASFRMEDSRQSQVTQGLQQSESMHSQNMKSYSESESEAFSKQANYLSQIAQQDAKSKNVNYEEMGEQGKALQQAVSYAQHLHGQHNYTWDQAAEAAVKASASAGGKIFGVGGSVSADGSVSAKNASNQSVGKNTQLGRDHNTSANYSNLVKALSSESFAETNHFDQSMSKDVRSSYEQMKKSEFAVSQSQQQVEDWHKAKSVVDSQGASSSKEMTEELTNRCMVEWGTNDKQAVYKEVQRRSPDVMKVWGKMQQEDGHVQKLVSDIGAGRNRVSGGEADNKMDNFVKEHKGKISQNPDTAIENTAKEQGLDTKVIKDNITTEKKGGRGTLADKTQKLMADNSGQYNAMKKYNEQEHHALQAQTDKYEKDRIGTGKLGTLGGLVDGVGKLKDSPETTALNKGAYQNAEDNKNGKK